jgi:lysophospholipase L1-like esterase
VTFPKYRRAAALALVLGLTLPLVGAAPAAESNRQASGAAPAARPPHDFAKWEKEIAAFEAADRERMPPKGGVLFIGSSGIRLWKTLAQDFPHHKVINRGFGGSEIVDSTHFADRIVFPYEPRMIFLRAGGNDIHAGRTPGQVADDFREFVETVHRRLPNTDVLFIAWNPAPDRWGEQDKLKRLNKLVRKQAARLPHVGFVDAWDVSLTKDGKPRRELFVADQLHFNAEGYKLLVERVRPFMPTVKEDAVSPAAAAAAAAAAK